MIIIKTEPSYIFQHSLLTRLIFIITQIVQVYSQIEIFSQEESDW